MQQTRLIPEGFGLFTGPPKAGKSWAALGFALALSGGTNALGKVPTGSARPVLYLALEDGERRLQARCRQLLDGRSIPAELHYLTAATAHEVLPVIEAWLDLHGRRNPLVILDTLGKVLPPALPGEGAYQRDYRIGSRLKALTDTHAGSTLLVVHHVRKAGSDDWMDSTSGTNGLNGAADFTLNLSRTRNEDGGVLRVTGRDVPENEFAVTSREGRWELDGEALAEAARKASEVRSTEGLGDRSAEIVRLVGTMPGGCNATAVASALGIEAHAARTYLSRLAEAGKITRAQRGLYTPVATVASVALIGEGPPDHRQDATHATDATPPLGACNDCGEPLHPALAAAGERLHASCGGVL